MGLVDRNAYKDGIKMAKKMGATGIGVHKDDLKLVGAAATVELLQPGAMILYAFFIRPALYLGQTGGDRKI
jgi:hypothetical protein